MINFYIEFTGITSRYMILSITNATESIKYIMHNDVLQLRSDFFIRYNVANICNKNSLQVRVSAKGRAVEAGLGGNAYARPTTATG